MSLKTAQQWKTGAKSPGKSAQVLIDIHKEGRIMPSGDNWKFFRFDNDLLTANNGDTFNASQLLSLALLQSIGQNTANENKALKQQITDAEDYIQYLETVTDRAPVIQLNTKKGRPSLSAPFDDNPYFMKSANKP